MTLGAPQSVAPSEGLRAYLDAALDCVIMADASGRVVEFNPAAERTFGYSRDEALGRTLAETIVPPSLRELHSQAFARFVETRDKRLLGRRLDLVSVVPRRRGVHQLHRRNGHVRGRKEGALPSLHRRQDALPRVRRRAEGAVQEL